MARKISHFRDKSTDPFFWGTQYIPVDELNTVKRNIGSHVRFTTLNL